MKRAYIVDTSHGSPFDRGAADSYYWRAPYPHKWPGGDYTKETADLTADEVEEYLSGYAENLERKKWQ